MTMLFRGQIKNNLGSLCDASPLAERGPMIACIECILKQLPHDDDWVADWPSALISGASILAERLLSINDVVTNDAPTKQLS